MPVREMKSKSRHTHPPIWGLWGTVEALQFLNEGGSRDTRRHLKATLFLSRGFLSRGHSGEVHGDSKTFSQVVPWRRSRLQLPPRCPESGGLEVWGELKWSLISYLRKGKWKIRNGWGVGNGKVKMKAFRFLNVLKLDLCVKTRLVNSTGFLVRK